MGERIPRFPSGVSFRAGLKRRPHKVTMRLKIRRLSRSFAVVPELRNKVETERDN